MPRSLRYSNTGLQSWWEGLVAGEMQTIDEEIRFFVAFSRRQITRRENNQMSNEILAELMKRQDFLKRALAGRDYDSADCKI